MEKIYLHRGLDGSDSFLASDHGGNRNRRQDRCVNQRYPKSKTKIQTTTRAHAATASQRPRKSQAVFRRQSYMKITEFSYAGNEPWLSHTFIRLGPAQQLTRSCRNNAPVNSWRT